MTPPGDHTGGVVRQGWQRIRAIELLAQWQITVLPGWSSSR